MLGDYRVSLGKRGEELACAALRRHGYAILTTRYRTRCGEIDVIAQHGRVLVFVEVKAKAAIGCGTAREAVTSRKRRRVISMAVEYLASHRISARALRFDVVAVTMRQGQSPLIEIIQNAFTLDDR